MMFTEVKELIDDEESQKGTNKLKQSKGPTNEPIIVNDDDGEWDEFSELGASNQLEGESNKGSEFGGLGGANNLNLLGAIKDAKGQTVEQIDDEFEIDPDLNDRHKDKLSFVNNRDNLRQGVSSGFNFKDILKNGQPCSEDELEDMIGSGRGDNPLSLEDQLHEQIEL